ncbi:MAG TPA: ferritin-like protein [Allosphingosinicella sp.]|jgi:hypothetical protein|nr:ferritin-like protein [Allosphingosinicella sp.]
MIRLQAQPIATLDDARDQLQTAINLELATLPVYLYTKFSILPDTNAQATADLSAIVGEEMTHMCLACNVLNALGGTPQLQPLRYPSTMPGDIGTPGQPPLRVSLLRFSEAAMQQGMLIEQPVKPVPVMAGTAMLGGDADPQTETIGEFYDKLDAFLATLPPDAWHANRNQIDDSQFFPGQIYAVNGYPDASRAISQIKSEGEGTPEVILDFEDELAHYYRFWSLSMKRQLTKGPDGSYHWGAPIDVDFDASFPAIDNPSLYDFSHEPPAAQAAQAACNLAYAQLIDELQRTFSGEKDRLGAAVRAMFDLRKAAMVALRTPLLNGGVAGPAFLYLS